MIRRRPLRRAAGLFRRSAGLRGRGNGVAARCERRYGANALYPWNLDGFV